MLYRRDRSQYWWVSFMRDGKRIRRSTGETDRSKGRYRAQITLSGRVRHVGLFDTPEAARAAYLTAKQAA